MIRLSVTVPTGENQQFKPCPTLRLIISSRKITGSTYSTNAVVPQDGFKVTSGKPKVFSKTADSGNKIHSYFCGDCGTTLYRDGDSFNGAKIVKAGVLDDYAALNNAKPAVELYAPERVDWVVPVPGADQKQGMS